MTWFVNCNTVLQAFLASVFTWGVTALGASLVFFFKKVNRSIMDLMMGFGAGVMIAASFWSLLAPAIELSGELGNSAWFAPAIGFLSGGLMIIFASKLMDSVISLPHSNEISGHSMKRSLLLVFAVTLHNIPEGMAVGVAFGILSQNIQSASLMNAILLAVGIGLQNFPEGAAVSLPLRREGFSRAKAFLYGQASGLVEPIACVAGALAAMFFRSLLPFALSFSAGAMVAVVSSELIPEASLKHKNLTTLGVVCGFLIMMILDVALG